MSELFHKFRKASNIEFEDMMSIALAATYELLLSYKYKLGFYNYWKKGVTFKLYKYINENSLSLTNVVKFGDDYIREFAASSDNTVSQVTASLLNEQIRKTLLDPINRFKMLDVEMYLLEFEKGYSYKEIANIYGLKYHTVRLRNTKTKERLKNILFNSKE